MRELYVVVNEKIFYEDNIYFCENKDIQSIVDYLSKKFKLFLISRSSKFVQPFKLKSVYRNLTFQIEKIVKFLLFFFNLKRNNKKLLIISITPFNFIIFLCYKFFFKCKFYLYLRSNGHEEYQNILGKRYVWIYDIMFRYTVKYSEIITCHKRLYNNKCHILNPSELNLKWKVGIKKNNFNNNIINLLYVGRFKVEKGIYSLLNIFSKLQNNIKLTLVGRGELIKFLDSRIRVVEFVENENQLINFYDSANILILPSYTEAHPKVIDEASRMRPVIIFNDIKYVIQDRYGIFSIKRNSSELARVIHYIRRNNKLIYSQLKKNILPQRNDFLKKLYKIIS